MPTVDGDAVTFAKDDGLVFRIFPHPEILLTGEEREYLIRLQRFGRMFINSNTDPEMIAALHFEVVGDNAYFVKGGQL